MKKYEQRIVDLEMAKTIKLDVDSVNGRIENLELRTDENEQNNNRFYLGIYGVELDDGKDGESGPECFQEVQNMLKEELNLDISEILIDHAHRIGPMVDHPVTGKRHRQIIIRFAKWRHRTVVLKERKVSEKFKMRPDLTHRRV